MFLSSKTTAFYTWLSWLTCRLHIAVHRAVLVDVDHNFSCCTFRCSCAKTKFRQCQKRLHRGSVYCRFDEYCLSSRHFLHTVSEFDIDIHAKVAVRFAHPCRLEFLPLLWQCLIVSHMWHFVSAVVFVKVTGAVFWLPYWRISSLFCSRVSFVLFVCYVSCCRLTQLTWFFWR